jgi:hypothetical protein
MYYTIYGWFGDGKYLIGLAYTTDEFDDLVDRAWDQGYYDITYSSHSFERTVDYGYYE